MIGKDIGGYGVTLRQRQTDRQTDRQADRQTYRYTDTHTVTANLHVMRMSDAFIRV